LTDQFQIAVGWTLALATFGSAIAVGLVAGRRRGIMVGIAAGATMFVGMGSAGFALAHLVGVLYTAAVLRADYFSYNFRFAALVLIGIMIVIAGALCITAAGGLARRQRPGWDRAMSGTFLLLVVNAPLVPVQPELAGGLMILGASNLAVLLSARSRFAAG
jgi:hypothetical protein